MFENRNINIQVNGQAVFTCDENGKKYVQFLPDDPKPGLTEGWIREGVGQLLKNGTYDFIARKRIRACSTLIKKVAHGAIQLTLKIFKTEGVNICETLRHEVFEATDGLNI